MVAIDELGNINGTELKILLDNIGYNNNAFFLVSMGVIIFLMQCGFAFLEAGSVRSKNTTNILIKNLLDSCISSIAYWACGYAFAYGDDQAHFIGGSKFMLINFQSKEFPQWFFQFVFAATASTIVSGALAERCEFIAYFAYCAFLTGFVYPVITHWAWDSKGWLNQVGFKDFAGSGVVHVHGGISALVGAILLGPRIGRFPKKGQQEIPLVGHSVPFAAMGGFLLMFGFFAFNGGSQANIDAEGDGEIVAMAMCNTMLSGGFAALTVLFVCKMIKKNKKWSLLLSINAVLTGMVSACAGCDAIQPYMSFFVGIGAGLSYMGVSTVVELLKIDDPVDAVAVHFGGGLWGLIAAPLVMEGGCFFAQTLDSGKVLGWNLVGALAIAGWSAVMMGGLFLILRLTKTFRVPAEVELKGLDIFKHGEPAYPVAAYGHGWIEIDGEEGRKSTLHVVDAGNPMPISPAHFDRYENSEMQAMRRVHPSRDGNNGYP